MDIIALVTVNPIVLVTVNPVSTSDRYPLSTLTVISVAHRPFDIYIYFNGNLAQLTDG